MTPVTVWPKDEDDLLLPPSRGGSLALELPDEEALLLFLEAEDDDEDGLMPFRAGELPGRGGRGRTPPPPPSEAPGVGEAEGLPPLGTLG